MFKDLKKLTVTIVYIIVMLLCVLAAILYSEGYYDISFIRRRAPEESLPESALYYENVQRTKLTWE